ncbi:hypothetical protein ALP72_04488 [Pseudomonas coronafaciens pv. coronafaciens]|uniref:hypothetical protein n=1 Tax=Pseudomonas coronafaciens TaxID=53409 RepID=UPI000EFE9577|nr:hypothetical protein [Pseudomonas coronafaciens]RMS14222.1 hypothetical protein ALP72_04488 [Pseudomonas coronafaciens pv. coronafaciens]
MTPKDHVSLTDFQFNQKELDQRIVAAKYQFHRSYDSVDRYSKPASLLLPELQILFAAGRKLSEHFPANSFGVLSVFLVKENIEDLEAQIVEATTAKYLAELEEKKEKNKLLLAEQLFSEKKAKEAKALQAKEEKEKQAALAEAQAFFDNLSTTQEAV